MAKKKVVAKKKSAPKKKPIAKKKPILAKKKPAQKKKAAPKKATPIKKVALKNTPAMKVLDLSKMISPLDDRLIVQVEKAEKITAGGLYIPDTAEIAGNLNCRVVAVGRGHRNKFGKIQPMEVKVGDRIMLAEHSGDQIEILGHNVKIVREGDVLGILE